MPTSAVIHTHTDALIITHTNILYQEKMCMNYCSSQLLHLSRSILHLKYLLMYFLLRDGLWCTTSYSSVFDCFFTNNSIAMFSLYTFYFYVSKLNIYVNRNWYHQISKLWKLFRKHFSILTENITRKTKIVNIFVLEMLSIYCNL